VIFRKSYGNLSRKAKLQLMSKERAMTLMGLYSDYSENDVMSAFREEARDLGIAFIFVHLLM
jgi:hypothetical protein